MKVLVAPDKFKGSLTAAEACHAIEKGLRSVNVSMEIQCVPLADGGDGTLEVLYENLKGTKHRLEVLDPLGRNIVSQLGVSLDGETAFIEMANASGMKLVKEEDRDVMRSSTYGTGQLIARALDLGAWRILLGIGGSATNDAGLGASEALGFRFSDLTNKVIHPFSGNLSEIARIDTESVLPQLKNVNLTALCDVTLPFAGPSGAAYTFAPQKGATPDQVRKLDEGLLHVASIFKKQFGVDVQAIPGMGAGGGLPAAAMVLWGARLRKGTDLVFEVTRMDERIQWADVVITGEGKLDDQSLHGKLFDGISRYCLQRRKKLVVIAGSCELSEEQLKNAGVDDCVSLSDQAGSSDRAMRDAGSLLLDAARGLGIRLTNSASR